MHRSAPHSSIYVDLDVTFSISWQGAMLRPFEREKSPCHWAKSCINRSANLPVCVISHILPLTNGALLCLM